MADSIRDLRDDLVRIETFLTDGSFLSFSPEERASLIADSHKYLRKLDGLAEGFLTVGLLGGTGVGKSSLMNALAGSEISSMSHRRPHTDQVLVYRHRSADVPLLLRQTTVPWREITHEAETIRQILLCDLPDFDSLLGAHREHVLRFLEHLDVLVWVTSPEKYADERFYAFLRQVPKARQNFYYVINKVDLFFDEQPPGTGYEELAKVTTIFHRHLSENGIEHPLIYALSARDVIQSGSASPWNQFPTFRHQIFQHRDVKEVMTIKAANLDVEVQQLFSILEKEVSSLAAVRQIIKESVDELEGEREQWIETGKEVFNVWLGSHVKREAFTRLADLSPLVGPGYGIGIAIQESRGWLKREEKDAVTALSSDKGVIGSLKRRMERVEQRVVNRLLRSGLPSELIKRTGGLLDVEREWEGLLRRLHEFLEMRLESSRVTRYAGFRVIQYAIYLILLLFLIVALGGEAWSVFVAEPGWSSLGIVFLTVIGSLFSPYGLAALGSYILLHIFFGFRFYSRYKKMLQRHAQKFIDSLQYELEKVWEDELNAIISRLADYDQQLEAQISSISVLRERHR